MDKGISENLSKPDLHWYMVKGLQKTTVEEYLIDLNATQACIRAGYSAKTANEQGCQNLAKLSIQQAIVEKC